MAEENYAAIANFVGYAIIVIVVVIVLFRTLVTIRWNRHKAATVGKWQDEGIEFTHGPVGGQFGGLESTGAKQAIRGIGLAMMTEKDVRVTRATPPITWSATYKQIKGVTIQPKFLDHQGKTPFLVVRFVKDGKTDKFGFQVKDFEEWAEDLAEAASVSLKDQRD